MVLKKEVIIVDRKKALLDNFKCFDKLDEIKQKVLVGEDIYSVVASYIFNVSPNECREFNVDWTKNEEGKRRRDVAKYLCLNWALIDDIATKYSVPNLHDLIVKAFPYTPYDEIDTDNELSVDCETIEDKALYSYSFITLIRGYCLMAWNRVKVKDLFDEMGYRYEDTE